MSEKIYTVQEVALELAKKLREVLDEEGVQLDEGVQFDDEGDLRFATPLELIKQDPSQGSWLSQDGLVIPRVGSASRAEWDTKFEEQVRSAFGNKLERVRIPIDSMVQRNPPVNGARLQLYSDMVDGGDTLPPVVVQKLAGDQYYLLDGNHRYNAAKGKLTHLDAFQASGMPSKKKKKQPVR